MVSTTNKISMCWKAFVVAFPLVGNWVSQHIGDERRIIIGHDPWVGLGET